MKIVFMMALNVYTGVTVYTYEVIKGLSKRGYDISVGFLNNVKSQLSNSQYVKDVSKYAKILDGNVHENIYDVAFLHNTVHEKLGKVLAKKTVFISHNGMCDTGNWNNADPRLKHNIHVGVSDRIQFLLQADTVIRNGIDLNKYTSSIASKKEPTRCLYHARHSPQPYLIAACKELNIKLDYWKKPQKNVKDRLDKADFVLAYGRSAYEAMAMSKPVLVFGRNLYKDKDVLIYRGYARDCQGGFADGWINEENFETLLYRNCSGWQNKIIIENKDEMINLIKDYDPSMGQVNRKLAEKFLSIEQTLDSFEEILKKI